MKIGKYLKQRSDSWMELERLNTQLTSKKARHLTGEDVAKFAQHYRSTCSDLAMANENKLPTASVRYLHGLVSHSHRVLYGSGIRAVHNLMRSIFVTTPRRVLNDVCVQIASLLFFGLFAISALCGYAEDRFPGFAERVVGEKGVDDLENSFKEPIGQTNSQHYVMMSAYYIQHNTSIGLRCFGTGLLVLPCILEVISNAVVLGASFGYMARDSSMGGENFMEFVTAHGPFELTAIALAAAAGLKIGVGIFITVGYRRLTSTKRAAIEAIPIIMSSVVLFILAAFTEGCISPTPLPYIIKAMWAVASSLGMMIYFVVLGSAEGVDDAA
jgi:uncharacterized membrane protein SpoIIM required for sporulation